MAQTTNYNFEIPDDTDLVKDGALAMRDLGQDVDTQLFTALGGDYPGLRLVKKQTIGTGVSSVQVTDAFSATYDAYKIIITGGAGSADDQNMNFKIGSSTTAYSNNLIFTTYTSTTVTGAVQNNINAYIDFVGDVAINGLSANFDVVNPFLSKWTFVNGRLIRSTLAGTFNGIHKVASSFTDFTIGSLGATMTGGTIYVYGYGAS
jgi:hypothetical protein